MTEAKFTKYQKLNPEFQIRMKSKKKSRFDFVHVP